MVHILTIQKIIKSFIFLGTEYIWESKHLFWHTDITQLFRGDLCRPSRPGPGSRLEIKEEFVIDWSCRQCDGVGSRWKEISQCMSQAEWAAYTQNLSFLCNTGSKGKNPSSLFSVFPLNYHFGLRKIYFVASEKVQAAGFGHEVIRKYRFIINYMGTGLRNKCNKASVNCYYWKYRGKKEDGGGRSSQSVFVKFPTAVLKHHDQDNLQEKAFNWAYSFWELDPWWWSQCVLAEIANSSHLDLNVRGREGEH